MIHNLAQIVEQSANRFPEKEAFRCLDKSISYSDLDLKANQLAAHLIESGVCIGDRVGIYMNRCLDTAIAVYGILKAGAAYVPIDPFMPLSRAVFFIKDCGIEQLITTSTQIKKLKAIKEQAASLKFIVGISDEALGQKSVSWDRIFSRSLDDYKPPRILEQDLAFILYTSGSTGVPKGIMHTHYSGLSLAKLAANCYDFRSSDRVGTFAPLHFDPSTFSYYASPLVGATAVIIPDAHLKMPVSLSALVEKEKLTIWFSVPLVLIQILLNGEIEKHDFGSLRRVLFAGEVFITKHLRALMKKWPHAQFTNLYGPTEVISCTHYNVPEPPESDDPIPIGKVWGNTDYKILDPADQEVDKGGVGQLVVRTATMMKGYWNNTELSEKSFYRLKIASGYDHIYYKTGDLVRQDSNDQLLFLGRNDRQIKFRGYRVELDEVELMLLKHEDVKEVGVIVVDRGNENTELVAAIVPVLGADIDTQALTAFCRSLMPAYAVPQTLKIMSDFPRTGSGKIDRNAIAKILTEES